MGVSPPSPLPMTLAKVIASRGGSRIFRREGGLTVMRGCMAVARGRVPGTCVLTFVAKFIFLWHLHLFIAARFLLACVFRELVILMRYD